MRYGTQVDMHFDYPKTIKLYALVLPKGSYLKLDCGALILIN